MNEGTGFRPRIKYGVAFFRRYDGRMQCWFNWNALALPCFRGG